LVDVSEQYPEQTLKRGKVDVYPSENGKSYVSMEYVGITYKYILGLVREMRGA
jgi:hypothetical protein